MQKSIFFLNFLMHRFCEIHLSAVFDLVLLYSVFFVCIVLWICDFSLVFSLTWLIKCHCQTWTFVKSLFCISKLNIIWNIRLQLNIFRHHDEFHWIYSETVKVKDLHQCKKIYIYTEMEINCCFVSCVCVYIVSHVHNHSFCILQ